MAGSGSFAPIRTADYVRTVQGWQTARIVPLGMQRWRIEDRGALQTVRFDTASGRALDLSRSTGVLGAIRHVDALYVALDPSVSTPVVALAVGEDPSGLSAEPRAPVLAEARGTIHDYRSVGCETTLTLPEGGETVWWTKANSLIDVSVEKGGTASYSGQARADGIGRVVVSEKISPVSSLRLRAPCGGE